MASKSVIDVKILGDNKGLSSALDDSESKIGTFAGNAGKLAVGAAAAVGGAVVLALGKGFSDALAGQDNDALIGARLGLDPGRAAELGDVAASAYRDAWGDSLAATTDTVTSLVGSFDGLTDANLEKLTGQAIALGDVFEIDVGQGIQTASELLESGLVDSADDAFDLLTRGLQEMPPAIRDELLAASQEYGDFFGDLGISGDVAFAKMTEYAEGGVYGIDKFGDSLKELTIRGTDMSAASVEAFDAAGLNAEVMADRFLAGGDTARGALEDTAQGLLDMEDPVERANAAIALFGTPLEDLGVNEIPDFLGGLRDMSTGLGDVEGAAQNMADTVGGTTSSKLESFKREALGALADFAANELLPRFEQVVGWFETNWPKIQEIGIGVWEAYKQYWDAVVAPVFQAIIDTASRVVEWVRTNWPQIQTSMQAVFDWLLTSAWPVVQQVIGFIVAEFDRLKLWVAENWPKIKETISNTLDAIWIVIETVIGVIQTAWKTWGDELVAAVTLAWDNIKAVVQAAIDIVRGIIDTVTSLIKGDWQGVWDGIKTILDGIWEAIKTIVSTALGVIKLAISAAWDAVKATASAAWDGIKGAISGAWDGIKTVASSGADAVVGFVAAIPGRLLELAGSVVSAGESIGKSIIQGIGSGLSASVSWFQDIGGAVLTAVKNAVNSVIDRVNRAVEISFEIPTSPWSVQTVSINPPDIPKFHSGGWVGNRYGAPRDVPAILQQGEYVLSRDEAADIARGRQGMFGDVQIITRQDTDSVRREIEDLIWAAGAA